MGEEGSLGEGGRMSGETRQSCRTLGEILGVDPAVICAVADEGGVKELLAAIAVLLSEIREEMSR